MKTSLIILTLLCVTGIACGQLLFKKAANGVTVVVFGEAAGAFRPGC